VEKVQFLLIANHQIDAFYVSNAFESGFGVASNDSDSSFWVVSNQFSNGISAFRVAHSGDRTGVDDANIGIAVALVDLVARFLKGLGKNGRLGLVEATP
jgi:hypothetical protein